VEHGYDGIKRLARRKRHPLLDTGGLVLGARVHAASLHVRDGGSFLSDEFKAGLPTLAIVRAGASYTGKWESRSP
jgi:hypothetical protein